MSKVKSHYLIKVCVEGEIGVHIRNIGPTDHVSVCGLDGGFADSTQHILPLKRGDKLDCDQCLTYYENRHGLNIDKKWINK